MKIVDKQGFRRSTGARAERESVRVVTRETGSCDIIENWEEAALLAIARLRTEIAHHGGDRVLERYAAQLAAHPRLQSVDIGKIDFSQAVIPSVFNFNGRRLSLFTTLAQFGAVQDVVACDIRVELMFPSDDATREYFAGK